MKYFDSERACSAGLRPTLTAAATLLLAAAALLGSSTPVEAQRRSSNRFSHEPHRNVACAACHASEGGKVGPARVSEQQCFSCHHTDKVGAACTRCHVASELTRPIETVQHFRLTVTPQPIARTLVLNHQQHAGLECRACHKEGPKLKAGALPCGSCHEQHHQPDADCRACHESRPHGAHGNAVHLGCGGSACHVATPVPASARTRQVCLSCHADHVDHFPAGNCVDCHVLPAATHARR